MNLPFDIPQSLSTYIEQYENDPPKVITKLKNHLKRRGPDAVGFFLLAWILHLKGADKQAVHYALKAKTFAPGSPLMENLHYYLSHPSSFDAWKPMQPASQPSTSPSTTYRPAEPHEPTLNLDSLIERLSEVDSGYEEDSESKSQSIFSFDLSELENDDIDDIASETLANIHETQGKTEAAIRTYKRLKKLNKDKKEFYLKQIDRLQKLSDTKGKGEEEEKRSDRREEQEDGLHGRGLGRRSSGRGPEQQLNPEPGREQRDRDQDRDREPGHGQNRDDDSTEGDSSLSA